MLDVTQGEGATMLRSDTETTTSAIRRLRSRGLVLPGRGVISRELRRARGSRQRRDG